jgi:hypothetical protein
VHVTDDGDNDWWIESPMVTCEADVDVDSETALISSREEDRGKPSITEGCRYIPDPSDDASSEER